MWQALAELYHVQPPLVPEDAACCPIAATDSSHAPSSALLSTPAGQTAAATGPQAQCSAEVTVSSFISRQQLGICSTADTPMTDSAAPNDEAVGVTAYNTVLQDTAMAAAAAAFATQTLPGAQHNLKPPVQQQKPLCSQEWNVQHVSSRSSVYQAPALCSAVFLFDSAVPWSHLWNCH